MAARDDPPSRRGRGRAFRRPAGLRFDRARRIAELNGHDLGLRPKEFDLLSAFALYPGEVLTRDQLLKLAWGFPEPVKTRTVDMHVHNLRQRLAGTSLVIETRRGAGYRLSQQPE
jgi:DNA-binding response OmpR family regulator